MSISDKSRKMLWGRAANRCAFPGCRIELFYDITGTDDPATIGEECHIVARSGDFKRGDADLTAKQRDLYGNLILLCRNHHKVVDHVDDPYTVDVLKQMKTDHEEWVRESLAGYDPQRQRDDEVYATYVDQWVQQADIDCWNVWADRLVSNDHPSIRQDRLKRLEALRTWLFARVWPRRYPQLEAAFENFRLVLGDLVKAIHEFGEEVGVDHDKMVWVEKIYKKPQQYNGGRYHALLEEFEFRVGIVEDLTLELTRAANMVCSLVRQDLLPSFRLEQGLVVLTAGPFMGFTYKTYKPQYASEADPANAYPGWIQFLIDREQRDINFGIGATVEEYRERKGDLD